MRIVALLPHTMVGGTERRVHNLIRLLPEHAWYVIDMNPKLNFMQERLTFSELTQVRAVLEMKNPREQLDKIKPDVILTYGRTCTILAKIYRKGEAPPIVFTGGTDSAETYEPWNMIRDVASAAVAVSFPIAGGFRSRKSVLIPTGVDLELFFPREHPKRVLTLGFLGRLAGVKNLELAPKALAGLRSSFIVYGPNTEDGVLDRLFLAANRAGVHVDFRGTTKEPWNAYHEFDVMLLLSCREGMPNAVLEAAACGIPTIATRVGALPDTFVGGESIIFINHPNHARSVIRNLMANPDEIERIGANARKVVERKHDIRRMAEQYNRLFFWVVEKKPPQEWDLSLALSTNGGLGDALMTEPVCCALRTGETSGFAKLFRPEISSIFSRATDPPFRVVDSRYEAGKNVHAVRQHFAALGLSQEQARPPRLTAAMLEQPPRETIRHVPRVGIHAWSDKTYKRWPTERWNEIARRTLRSCDVVQLDPGPTITGTERRYFPNVRRFIEEVAQLDLLLTNEGFPSQVAEAVLTPCVTLCGGAVDMMLVGYNDQINIISPYPCSCQGGWKKELLNCTQARSDKTPLCLVGLSTSLVMEGVKRALNRLQVEGRWPIKTQGGFYGE